MKILKQLLFIALISGGSLIASLSDKEKHDLITNSGLPTTSIDQIQRNLSRLKKHGHLSAANKVQTILDTRKGAQSADTKSDQQLAATLAEIKQQLELDRKIDQLALQLQQSKQQPTHEQQLKQQIQQYQGGKLTQRQEEQQLELIKQQILQLQSGPITSVTAEEIVKMSNNDLYKLFSLDPNMTGKQLEQQFGVIMKRILELYEKYGPENKNRGPFADQAMKKIENFLNEIDSKTTMTFDEWVNQQ